MPDPTDLSRQSEIIAPPGRYYRNARYIIFLLCIGFGAAFNYDGWIAWPRQNADDLAHGRNLHHPSKFDIPLQKALGIVLPVAGIGILALMLRNSRGQYRLADKTVYVPGHPPIPLAAIRTVDKTRWDRKGIATITYELAPGRTSSFNLDDFHYQQAPTDEILRRIEAHIRSLSEESPATQATSGA